MSFTKSGKSNLKTEVFLIFSALTFFGMASLLHLKNPKPNLIITKQDSAINIKNLSLKLFSLGNKRLISSILWIQTLLESDLDHYSKKDLNNWMYLRFLSISELEPLFYENYLYGGIFLSIVKDDLLGAANIYDKGLRFYPDDYKLNYNSGFNYYYELGDLEKGLNHFKKIENHPDLPHSLKLLINKIKFVTTKDYDTAISFLEFQLENLGESSVKEKIKKDLYALHAMRDLECLNTGNDFCNKKDYEGNDYIFKNKKWLSSKKFYYYKLFKTKN
jgi:tetratricopeptide (TPR) repeat protein